MRSSGPRWRKSHVGEGMAGTTYPGRLAFFTIVLIAWGVFMSQRALAVGSAIQYAFWGGQEQTEIELEIIDAFEAAYPDITVEAVANAGGSGYASYHDKLITLFASGLAPDVMRIDSYYFADFAAAGLLLPIDDLLDQSDTKLEHFFPIALEDVRYGGKILGLPWGSYPLLRYYNQDLFDQAGLSYPSLDWTWDEYVKTVQRLTRKSGDEVAVWGTEVPTSCKFVLSTVWSHGGRLFDDSRTTFRLHEPDSVAGLRREVDLIHQYQVAPLTTNWSELFVQGRLGIGRDFLPAAVSFAKQGLSFNWDVHLDPVGPAGQYALWKGNATSISRSTRNTAAAWTFLQFLLGPTSDGTMIYVQHKRMSPQTPDGRMWRLFSEPNRPPASVGRIIQYIAMNAARSMPVREGWASLEPLIDGAFGKARNGMISPQGAMNEIAKSIQSVLDRTGIR